MAMLMVFVTYVQCGQEKPSCSRCVLSNLHCGGYQTNYEFLDQGPNFPPTRALQREAKRKSLVPLSHMSPNPGPQHKFWLLDRLQDMCVPQGGIETVLSSWMGASCDLARKEEDGPLSDVLLAISIQKTEGIWSKVKLCQSALELYQKALGALRNSLQGAIANEQHELIVLTCFACCMFEVGYFLWIMWFGLWLSSKLSCSTSFVSASRHLRGLGSVIGSQKPGILSSQIGRNVLQDFRALDVSSARIENRLIDTNELSSRSVYWNVARIISALKNGEEWHQT